MSNPTSDSARSDALGYIEQTIYANEDNSPAVTWTHAEVREMLFDIAERLRLDCDCEDREAIVTDDGMTCGTCGVEIEPYLDHDDGGPDA